MGDRARCSAELGGTRSRGASGRAVPGRRPAGFDHSLKQTTTVMMVWPWQGAVCVIVQFQLGGSGVAAPVPSASSWLARCLRVSRWRLIFLECRFIVRLRGSDSSGRQVRSGAPFVALLPQGTTEAGGSPHASWGSNGAGALPGPAASGAAMRLRTTKDEAGGFGETIEILLEHELS